MKTVDFRDKRINFSYASIKISHQTNREKIRIKNMNKKRVIVVLDTKVSLGPNIALGGQGGYTT